MKYKVTMLIRSALVSMAIGLSSMSYASVESDFVDGLSDAEYSSYTELQATDMVWAVKDESVPLAVTSRSLIVNRTHDGLFTTSNSEHYLTIQAKSTGILVTFLSYGLDGWLAAYGPSYANVNVLQVDSLIWGNVQYLLEFNGDLMRYQQRIFANGKWNYQPIIYGKHVW